MVEGTTAADTTIATAVPPRVIPMFVDELGKCPAGLRAAHLSEFHRALPRVLSVHCDAQDFTQLLMGLFDVIYASQSEANATTPSRVDGPPPIIESDGVLSLRILHALFSEHANHTVSLVHALKTLSARFQIDDFDPSLVEAPQQDALRLDNSVFPANHLHIDSLIDRDDARPFVLALFKTWDLLGIDIRVFTAKPELQHTYFPQRFSSKAKVYRDFISCTRRPKLTSTWGSVSCVHIKTNIPAQSNIMYRFVAEGYNYGVNAVLHNDIVGYTNQRWTDLCKMEEHGWPEGWDAGTSNDYSAGAHIDQYYSSDRFVVIRLRAKSMFGVGFSVSAWLVFPGFGSGFPLSATIHHQDDDL